MTQVSELWHTVGSEWTLSPQMIRTMKIMKMMIIIRMMKTTMMKMMMRKMKLKMLYQVTKVDGVVLL